MNYMYNATIVPKQKILMRYVITCQGDIMNLGHCMKVTAFRGIYCDEQVNKLGC